MQEVTRKSDARRQRQLPELRDLVVEATQALTRLDADRLEELALTCQALTKDLSQDLGADLSPNLSRTSNPNRALSPAKAQRCAALARQAREAAGDMALFSRVLEATRANLDVVKRLWELRAGRLEYSEARARGWESRHGDH